MRPLRMIATTVVGLVGLCGLAGGAALLTDRTGGRVGLTVDELPAWPLLDDYTVPGAALVVLLGLLPRLAAWLLVRRHPRAWAATTAVGLVLVLVAAGSVVLVGLAYPLLQAAFVVAGVLTTGLGVDGGTSVGTSDESLDAVRS